MTPKSPEPPLSGIWRDDVAAPLDGPRLADILLDPSAIFSGPERIGRHFGLSPDEKRMALIAWLRGLLAEQGVGGGGASAQIALAELCALDPGAAAVYRRAFAARGFGPLCS